MGSGVIGYRCSVTWGVPETVKLLSQEDAFNHQPFRKFSETTKKTRQAHYWTPEYMLR